MPTLPRGAVSLRGQSGCVGGLTMGVCSGEGGVWAELLKGGKLRMKLHCCPWSLWPAPRPPPGTWQGPCKSGCSVAKSCPTLCSPMDCSTPGFSVLHYLPEFAQTHVHWAGGAIQSSYPLVAHFSSYPQSFPASRYFPMGWIFASGAQVLELQLQHQPMQ